jgi:uncharacterized protein YprB with RNaseH-like and TPR domain
MKPDLKTQLAHLRRRVKRIENRTPKAALAEGSGLQHVGQIDVEGITSGLGLSEMPSGSEDPAHYDAEQVLDGKVVENEFGSYFLQERFYPGHHRHGSMDISHLAELPGELLAGISRESIAPHDPSRWVFLDTETTGLSGGTGTCAFLVGVGTIEDGGFRVRLFFMRDYDEESAMLAGLAEFLRWYDVLITYNGKAYDAPLLDTRYRLQRKWFPFERMQHLDLLHGARQLWKLRMESCRLMQLEYDILGVLREGDLPGELIPYYYFEYLRTKQAFRLAPLFHHNVIDIVSLACLTAVVLPAFASPAETTLRHGADLLGLARWLRRCGEHESSLELYRRAVDAGLSDDKMFAALWETAQIEKKQGRSEAMLEILCDLAQVNNAHRQAALEELAKHYEHNEKNAALALEMTESALGVAPSPELLHRKSRLEKRLARQAKVNGLFERS